MSNFLRRKKEEGRRRKKEEGRRKKEELKLLLQKTARTLTVHINSGNIGINITRDQDTTRNQDTALPCPYNSSGVVGTRHYRVLTYHSGAAGIDIIPGF